MPSKIEIKIDKITNMQPEPKQIKEFSSLFTNTEWNRACLNKEFCNLVLTDLNKAKKLAESILGKKIGVKVEKEIVCNPS